MSSSSSLRIPESVTGVLPEYLQAENLPAIFWCGLVFLTVLGSLGISHVLVGLWEYWMNDPLQSIGMLIPPVSLVLVLRVWRQSGWELRGTLWGMLPAVLAFLLNTLRQDVIVFWSSGRYTVSLLPFAFPLYLYASGVVLFFAGARVWRQAWFPLALLVLAKPVPAFVSLCFDLPLQRLSAHIAMSFATLIHFAPAANPQMLKLMFTPDFGMFIAPGCDGMRGAVTMGYLALIIGYLKRVSIPRWFLYVTGAVLLGYLFNLIRLCTLVLYYRIAVGHSALENIAKQADYAIGGCLFLVATVFFLWIVLRKDDNKNSTDDLSAPRTAESAGKQPGKIYWKFVAFAILVLPASGVSALISYRGTLVPPAHIGGLTPSQLDELMPKQLGDYKLNRTWQQQEGSSIMIESAAYATAVSDEVILGVWLVESLHNINDSWVLHGKEPELRATKKIVTAQGQIVDFDTAFYSDGITDSFVGNAICNRSSCFHLSDEHGVHLGLQVVTPDGRMVPILFRVEKPHSNTPRDIVYKQLVAEAQSFLVGVDITQLSRKFQ
jgi:exosortase J